MSLKVLQAIISEYREGENEYNYKIIEEVSKMVLNREISPYRVLLQIQKKSLILFSELNSS